MFWILKNRLGTCALNEETPEGAIIIDIRDLKDGWNEPKEINKRIELVLKTLSMGFSVIIRCTAGISRSNVLAMAVLCYLNGKDWEENENLVRKKVLRTQINLSFKKACKKVLEKDRK